ncbi:hypothetical protein QF034_007227 [Streptomyces africanus]|uniref:Uncharacterized protein n=1 Tax=Streptomyces africanus TaxID=231024 RepID=A0ABU0R083_9ACTN|nr:hypothetical protein [Streptomyces africanus]
MRTLHGTGDRSGTLLVTGRGNDRVTELPRPGRGQVDKAPKSRHADAVPFAEPDHPHRRFDPHRRHLVR